MNGYYILTSEHEAIPVPLQRWASWFETANRVVQQETLTDGTFVSTVFLGLNHAWSNGPRLLFETMAFPSQGDRSDLACERCSTWDEALLQHALMVWRFSGAAAEAEG